MASSTTDTQGAWGSKAKGAGEYANVNGIKLYYETRGTGRPLILAARWPWLRRHVRSQPAGARKRPTGDHGRSAGSRPDGGHRPAAEHGADGRRHRGPHQAPEARATGPDGLFAGRGCRLLRGAQASGAGGQARVGLDDAPARRVLPGDPGPAGTGWCRGGRDDEANPDVSALRERRAAARGLAPRPRQDRRHNEGGLRPDEGGRRDQSPHADRRG